MANNKPKLIKQNLINLATIVAIFVVAFILLLILQKQSQSSVNKISEDTALSILAENAVQVEEVLENQIKNIWNHLETVDGSLAVLNGSDKEELAVHLNRVMQEESEIKLLTKDGRYFDNLSGSGVITINDNLFPLFLENRQTCVLIQQNHQDMLMFGMAIDPVTIDGETIEYLIAYYNLDTFMDLLSVETFSGNGKIRVINRDGLVLFSTDNLEDSLATYYFFGLIDTAELDDDQEISTTDELKESILNGENHAYHVLVEGNNKIISYAKLNSQDWFVTIVVDYDSVLGDLDKGITRTGRTSVLASLIIMLFAIAAVVSISMKSQKIMVEKDELQELNDSLDRANKVAEEALRIAEDANKAKSVFLSNMSHDIRTPMNAIIGFTTLASANTDNEAKVKDYLAKILSSSNHLLSLINDVLDMSRIESGKIHLEETEVDLSEILHDLRTIVGGQIHAKQLELLMDVMDVTDENVYCDKTRLNQVLLNLLSNAVKFTPPGGTISVRILQKPCENEGMGNYEFRVKDTGIGMSPEFAEKIFDPFERERNSTVSKIQGTGLGMAITKNIVNMMGGTIEVHTEQGKGTEFVFRVTLRKQKGKRVPVKIPELSGLKALVVDDDFNTCNSVTKMLRTVGMRSEWTLSGKEAVLRAQNAIEMEDSFRAYIIDWRLPDMNGIEVTRQIRSLDNTTPIIILTAYDWTDIEVEAKAAGVTAFCSKPMFMSDLRDTLLTAIGMQEAKEESILPSAEEHRSFVGRKILLVEDNELNREIAVEILHDYGFVIDTAENGLEAVEKVTASEPGDIDLILMDVQMPIMDGLEATRKIRAISDTELANVPIFAMTANAFNEDREAAKESGMDGFLSKPIDIDELIRMLSGIFG
ncbi:MAG: response regulator [Clostridia bacterium]|nr:response regulator [Clostridia bacterium]